MESPSEGLIRGEDSASCIDWIRPQAVHIANLCEEMDGCEEMGDRQRFAFARKV